MDCPVCGERLKEIERSGVMVDICPLCKGIWLDRGEIEKLLDSESGGARTVPLARELDNRHGSEKHGDHDDHDDHRSDRGYRDEAQSGDPGYGKKQRRSSLLGDILGGLGGD